MSLLDMGFTYAEAWDTTIAESRRYVAIRHAWSIAADQRDNMCVKATEADVAMEFGTNL